jgi:hypothetical protein
MINLLLIISIIFLITGLLLFFINNSENYNYNDNSSVHIGGFMHSGTTLMLHEIASLDGMRGLHRWYDKLLNRRRLSETAPSGKNGVVTKNPWKKLKRKDIEFVMKRPEMILIIMERDPLDTLLSCYKRGYDIKKQAKYLYDCREYTQEIINRRPKNTFVIQLEDYAKEPDTYLKKMGFDITNKTNIQSKTSSKRPSDRNHEKLRDWQVTNNKPDLKLIQNADISTKDPSEKKIIKNILDEMSKYNYISNVNI